MKIYNFYAILGANEFIKILFIFQPSWAKTRGTFKIPKTALKIKIKQKLSFRYLVQNMMKTLFSRTQRADYGTVSYRVNL